MNKEEFEKYALEYVSLPEVDTECLIYGFGKGKMFRRIIKYYNENPYLAPTLILQDGAAECIVDHFFNTWDNLLKDKEFNEWVIDKSLFNKLFEEGDE